MPPRRSAAAYQSGESIDASGGIRPAAASARGLAHVRAAVAEVRVEARLRRVRGAGADRCRRGRMSSAVCSISARSSSGLSVIGALCSSAADMISAAAPAALPVLVEPVGPCIEIDDLPPNWVVFALRK